MYGSVFDDFYGSLAVEREFELVAEFEDEELFGGGVAVEILFEGSGNVAISLDD